MPEEPIDSGLQAERTELAWRRTQLSLLVIACLALRVGEPVVMLLALEAALALWTRQGHRYRCSLAMLRDECGRARGGAVVGTSLVILLMALLAMAKALQWG